jgi:hypothetical protein
MGVIKCISWNNRKNFHNVANQFFENYKKKTQKKSNHLMKLINFSKIKKYYRLLGSNGHSVVEMSVVKKYIKLND